MHIFSICFQAIGKNIKQFPGPPEINYEEDTSEEDTEINLEHVTVNLETEHKLEAETKA